MTVICPNCEARFRDPPEEVATDQTVQCSKCEHEWTRAGGDEPPRIVVDAPPTQPTMRTLLDDQRESIQTNLPVVIENNDTNAGPHAPLYVDRQSDSAQKKRSVFLPAITLSAIVLVAGAIFAKDFVIENVPQAHSAYSAAGLISPSPELEIASVQTTKTTKDGIRQLIIRGEIENKASHQVPVPNLRLTMRGESNVRLYAWTVSAAKNQLKAGERSRFTAIAHDYPGDAVDVEVEFMPLKGKDK